MNEKSPTKDGTTRRTLLKVLGATTATGGLLGTSLYPVTAQERSFTVEQGEDCIPITPVRYQRQPVTKFYNYTEDVNSTRSPWEANTPLGVEKRGVSRLFLYRGPDGLSLVIIHDRGGDDSGGAATFVISGLPKEGEWVVRDDDHPSDPDIWNVSENETVVNWSWNRWHTDGGAFRGLPDEFEITIDPTFNEGAMLNPDTPGAVQTWETISRGKDGLKTSELQFDEPVTVRTGSCE